MNDELVKHVLPFFEIYMNIPLNNEVIISLYALLS